MQMTSLLQSAGYIKNIVLTSVGSIDNPFKMKTEQEFTKGTITFLVSLQEFEYPFPSLGF